MSRTAFSAVLLAGGRSTRMGRDKALLTLPGSDLLLWQRQLRVLEELQPQEILWSGFARSGLPLHVRIIVDRAENAGPLGGIGACLDVSKSDLLVVLAVDLPQMTCSFLENLLTLSSPDCGVVAQHGDFYEPLAAVYPKKLDALANEHLRQGRYAMQDFVREAICAGSLQAHRLAENEIPLFKNFNSPADVTS